MKISVRRFAQLSEDRFPIFRVQAEDRVFSACVVVGTCDAFIDGLSESAQETVRRMIEADGGAALPQEIWCMEVLRPADAMQQVSDAAVCARPRSRVAFLCADETTASEVARALGMS